MSTSEAGQEKIGRDTNKASSLILKAADDPLFWGNPHPNTHHEADDDDESEANETNRALLVARK